MWGWPCVAVVVMATGCGPDLYLMHRIEVRVEDDWFNHGGGCMAVDQGGGSSGGFGTTPGNSYEAVLTVEHGKGEFTVTVDGEVVEHRVFDEAFLRSGNVEEVTFELPNGEEQRHSFWGGPECESPAEPDTTAYEQAKREAEQDAG